MKTSLIILLISPLMAFGQEIEKSATFVNELDHNITVKKISVMPILDNVDGIYARPFEKEITKLLEESHRFELAELKTVGSVLSPADLEANSQQVIDLAVGAKTDALIAGKVSKGPDGVSITLDLFMSFDGKLFAQETTSKLKEFDTKSIQNQAREMLKKILDKIPYQGLVLSRNHNRVTVDLGKRDGVAQGQAVTVIQIIKLNRHPKFSFVVSTDKEIIGKIRLVKVEDTLSFGEVIVEKERGVIQKNSKITGINFIQYTDSDYTLAPTLSQGSKNNPPQDKLIYGNQPQEWVPVRPPVFGGVSLALGMGSYQYNTTVDGSSYTGSAPVYFSLKLNGELWLTQNWSIEAGIRQGIFNTTNPRDGSSPSDLSYSLGKYQLLGSYHFLLKDDFFGPKVQLLFGFTQYSTTVDNSSPVALTSTQYRGLDFGIRGSLPLDYNKIWRLGAEMHLLIFPTVSESPVGSGSSDDNKVYHYSLLGGYRMGQRMEFIGSLEFEFLSSNFAGGGSRGNSGSATSTQRSTTLYGGINYLF